MFSVRFLGTAARQPCVFVFTDVVEAPPRKFLRFGIPASEGGRFRRRKTPRETSCEGLVTVRSNRIKAAGAVFDPPDASLVLRLPRLLSAHKHGGVCARRSAAAAAGEP